MLRGSVAAVGLAATLASFIAFFPVLDFFLLGLILLSLVPFVLYLVFVRSRVWTLVIGVLLLIATLGIYTTTLLNEHSTAALGFLAAIVVNHMIITVGIVRDLPTRPEPRAGED